MPGLERREGGALDVDAAVDGDLGGGDAGGVDVEADELVLALVPWGIGAGVGEAGTTSHRHIGPRT